MPRVVPFVMFVLRPRRLATALAAVVAAVGLGAIGACDGDAPSHEPFAPLPDPEDAGEPSDPGPGFQDAEPIPSTYLTTCEERGDKRAVLLAVQGANVVKIITQDGGSLVDKDLHIDGLTLPRRVAMRSDGREGIVAFGNVTAAGLAVIDLAPDGSSASLAYTVDLGSGVQPYAVTYVGPDRLLVAGSSSKHTLMTLDRAGGTFKETVRTDGPGAFTFALHGRDDSPHVLLSRFQSGTDDATRVQQVKADAMQAFLPSGAVAEVRPPSIDLVVHTSGKVAYTPTSNPDDPVTQTNLQPGGFLHSLTVDGPDVSVGSKTALPRIASRLAIDPRGRFVVLQGNYYENTGTPSVKGYAVLTVPLEPDGKLGTALPETPPAPGVLFNDLKIAPSGHLLASKLMDSQTSAEGEEYPLELSAQISAGTWTVCQRIFLPALAAIAIAPLKGSSVR